jgi:hypothetical protein
LLREVDNIIQFTSKLEHYSLKNVKSKPSQTTFLAAIIGNGCNIGLRRLAKISRGINENTLLTTANWYFSTETLLNVNREIVSAINKLALSGLYVDNLNEIHTGSDGRKVGVSVESLESRYSFKYFGKGKGVSVYSFLDPRQHVYFSEIINPSEREASYVIDGLVNNSGIESKFHSTDTHGYTECIFGLTYLMGISFAPRLASLSKQQLYTMTKKDFLSNKYKTLKPKGVISRKLISSQWDNILRFVATIKLQYATASQLFSRLNPVCNFLTGEVKKERSLTQTR